jgi:putative transposase
MYETSLSDAAWEVIEHIFYSSENRGRPRIYEVRHMVDAILYVVKNGCVWRCLPHDFPPWKTVYHYFRIWSLSGLWRVLNETFIAIARTSAGKEETPSLVSIDSQSQSAEPGVRERGLDGGKKVNGRKRHIVVDTLGLVLLCMCSAANISDSVVGQKLVATLNTIHRFPRLKKILGDNSYRSVGAGLPVGVTVGSSERTPGQKGFVPQAFRWAVERTFAWLNRQRRLVRNYEKRVIHQESMNYIANIRLCLKRYEKWLLNTGC